MLQVLNVLIGVCSLVLVFFILRWIWFRCERAKLIASNREILERSDAERFPERGDFVYEEPENDRRYHGRVITSLRAQVKNGQVHIHWKFGPEFIHRGFVLTGQSRQTGGEWEPLAFESFEDSGEWHEALEYGESKSYFFTVKKMYHFAFGLLPNDEMPVLYDQLSFVVRNGRALKERRELMTDRRVLLEETKEYLQLVNELRGMSPSRRGGNNRERLSDPGLAALEDRMSRERMKRDFVERETAKINAHATWSDERKAEEIQRLNDLLGQLSLEED